MTITFQSLAGLIIVPAAMEGPAATVRLRLALDTGATSTIVDPKHFVTAGYDPALAPTQVPLTTATTVHFIPLLTVTRLTALGQDRTVFPILGHTLPPRAGVDGLLGLDFLRGRVLTLDFPNGTITLT